MTRSLALTRHLLIYLLWQGFFESGAKTTEGRLCGLSMADARAVLVALMATFGAAFVVVIVGIVVQARPSLSLGRGAGAAETKAIRLATAA